MVERSHVKPKLRFVALLRCPLCGQTPLRAEGAYLRFRKGCLPCNYAFDRHEDGYFQGAAWMVNYGLLSLVLLVAGALLLLATSLDGLVVAALLSGIAFGVGLAIHPWCRALWMWLDLNLHPLGPEESLSEPRRSQQP